jgi:hypothetical protein
MVKAMDHTPLAPRERPSAPPLWNLVNLLNVPTYVCLLSEAYSKPGLLGSYGRAYTSDFSKKFGVYSYRWRVLEPNQRPLLLRASGGPVSMELMLPPVV